MVEALQRITLAARAAFAAFLAPSVAYGLLSSLSEATGHPPRRRAARLEAAYSELPWIRAVVGRMADSVAQPRWRLYRATGKKARRRAIVRETYNVRWSERFSAVADLIRAGDLEEVARHPLLDILHHGNPVLTGSDQRRLTSAYCDLVGDCYWILDRRRVGSEDVPYRAWVIPSSWCKETPTASNPFYIFRYHGWRAEIEARDVVHHINPDPLNPYGRGSGIAQALADELLGDESAARHIVQWFFQGGRPSVIIAGKGVRDKADIIARAEQTWIQKSRAKLPMWLRGEISHIKELGHSFDQMQLVQLRASLRDTIIQVFGYPPEMLGILSNSNRSTIGLAQELHAKNNVLPRLIRMQETVDRLKAEYRGVAENAVLAFDNPVERDREQQLKAARAQPHALDQNEWRELIGFPPKDGADVHLVANRYQSVERLDEVELIRPEPLERAA